MVKVICLLAEWLSIIERFFRPKHNLHQITIQSFPRFISIILTRKLLVCFSDEIPNNVAECERLCTC
jgi:hypothetical protein